MSIIDDLRRRLLGNVRNTGSPSGLQQPQPSKPPATAGPTGSIPGIVGMRRIALPWQRTTSIQFTQGFTGDQAFVFAFTPPAGASSNGQLCSFSISPHDGFAYNARTAALSDAPLDFSGKLGPGSIAHGQESTMYFTVGGRRTDRYGRPDNSVPDLTSGRTYYVSVIAQSIAGGPSTCAAGECNINYGLSLAPGM